MKKIIKYVLIIGVLAAFFVWLFVLYLPTKDWWNDMKKEKGGNYTAIQIVKDFVANEDSATKKYPSDKAIDVDGVIKDIKTEDGKASIWLKSDDSTVSVNFVMRDSVVAVKVGDNVTLRGTCTGKIEDVLFNDGVLVKNK